MNVHARAVPGRATHGEGAAAPFEAQRDAPIDAPIDADDPAALRAVAETIARQAGAVVVLRLAAGNRSANGRKMLTHSSWKRERKN